MPNDNDLTITLSLDDKASGPAKEALKGIGSNADSAAQQASQAMEEFGKSLQSVGREIGHVSATLAFLGGGIVAPFALALNNASKTSVEVSDQLSRLSNVTDEFQETLAQSVLPVVKQFTNQLQGLTDAFKSIPQPVRDATLQTILITGEVLLATAAVGLLSKEIIALVANVALLSGKFVAWVAIPVNAWIFAIVVGIGVLIGLMIQFKGVADTVISTFEVLFRYLVSGFGTIKLAVIGLADIVVSAVDGMLSALAKIPGPQQKAFQGMQQSVDGVKKTLDELANKQMNDIVLQSNKIGNIFKTGQGEWSQTFDRVKNSAMQFFTAHKNGTDRMVLDTKNAQKELVTLSNQLRDINIANTNTQYLNEKMQLNDAIAMSKFYQQNWMDAHASIMNFGIQTANAMKANLVSAVTDLITGAKTAAQAFADLGKAMIQMIVQYFVQKAVSMALDAAFGKAMIAASVATQIAAGAAITAAFAPAALAANIASFGGAAVAAAATFPVAASAEIAAMAASTGAGAAHLAGGTDTVPAMLTPGEMVVPQSMAEAIRQGSLTLGGPAASNFQSNGSQSQSRGNIYIDINIDKPTVSKSTDIDALVEEISRRLYLETQRIR